ncbi:MAG: hypothetical protein ACRD6W_17105 [Nitrososphaerales archaeon]
MYREESDLLRSGFDEWESTASTGTKRQAVEANWDHGTIGKLLVEHGPLRLAAKEDIVRALREAGRDELALQLSESIGAIRGALDQMYENGRGVQPIALATTPGFIKAVDEFYSLLRTELDAESETAIIERLSEALGAARNNLRSARFISKHAPSHPGPPRWYSRIGFLVRLHTAYDRFRGYPGAESSLGDRKLARRYDRER